MKRAALFVLSLVLVLFTLISFGEAPVFALTCEEICWQEAFQCHQQCQGYLPKPVQYCRQGCNEDYYVCVDSCP